MSVAALNGRMSKRPPFIVSTDDVTPSQFSYPNSNEKLAIRRALGEAAGLTRMGIHLLRVPPGFRTSWPHAEEKEEEFVFVVEGNVDAWVDGVLHPMKAGDFAAFPPGTGITHTFLNNSDVDAVLLVGGEADKRDNRITYPLHPQREGDLAWSAWWKNAPTTLQGDHDGLPDRLRSGERKL